MIFSTTLPNMAMQKGGYYISSTIQELLRLLDEDGSKECCFWASEIRSELRLNKATTE